MIRAGIIGGSNPMAGELIRVLINHPDVEILWVDSARYTGRLVSDVHHGLIGEMSLRITPFTPSELKDINALFIFRHKGQTIEWLEQHPIPENLRIIDLSVDMRDPATAAKYEFVYGLPELNRKPMVRGAKRAIVPHPAAIIAELALLPIAKQEELNSDITFTVSLPEKSEQVEDAAEVAAEIAYALRELQPGFNNAVTVVTKPAFHDRAMAATIEFDTLLDVGEMMRAYEEFYDDHNFTYLIQQEPDPIEVAGTNKCLMRIDKHDNRVTVTAAMDAFLKGAAGTAVHDMNLLFGFHERVGLALKATTY